MEFVSDNNYFSYNITMNLIYKNLDVAWDQN